MRRVGVNRLAGKRRGVSCRDAAGVDLYPVGGYSRDMRRATLPRRHESRQVVAGNVRAALARAQISVNSLPGRVGASQSYWSRRTTGEHPFSTDDLDLLADLLGMDPREFLAAPPRYTGPSAFGPRARSSTDRASDYGSVVRYFSTRPRHLRAAA